jgi:hypothetical protein
MAKPRFTFASFQRKLDIPAAEHAALAECVDRALDAAERQDWGSEGAPITPRDVFRVPHLLGYLAVAAVRHPALSPETKRKVVRHTLGRARPLEDNGTPRGLTVLVGFLAGVGELDLPTFTAALKTAEIERALFEEVTLAELLVLSDWLIGQPDLDERQRQWWLWFLVSSCAKYQLGQPWMDALLAHPALSTDFKHKLCEAWLSARPPGPAPQAWRKLDEALTAELIEAGPNDETGVAEDLDGLMVSMLDERDDRLEAEEEGADDALASFSVVGHLMRQALGGYVIVPNYIERQAVLGLARTGGDPLVVCQAYLESRTGVHAEPVNQGVADVISACYAQMPAEAVQGLVERGLSLPQTKARQAFYEVAAELYGPAIWERARQDSAASVRAWAEGKATKDDRRPLRATDP